MTEPDGAINAITGFLVQSMSALLESFRRSDWVELVIDPASDDGAYQKVDLLWRLRDGKVHVAQVKSSINSISVPDAKRWVDELQQRCPADLYRLILFAPTTGGVRELRYKGVTVEVLTGDVSIIWGSLNWGLHVILSERRRIYPTANIEETAKRLIGRTVVGVCEKKVWTPKSLEDLLFELAESCSRETSIPERADISLLRIIVADQYEACIELMSYTVTNTGDRPIAMPGWTIFWTDAEDVAVIRVTDGKPGNPEFHEIIDDTYGTLELQLVSRHDIIEPGCAVTFSAEVRRSRALQRVDGEDTWIFSDRLLPTDSPHRADVFVFFPCSGDISASGIRRKDRSGVHWQIITGSEHRRLNAVLSHGVQEIARDVIFADARGRWPSCPV